MYNLVTDFTLLWALMINCRGFPGEQVVAGSRPIGLHVCIDCCESSPVVGERGAFGCQSRSIILNTKSNILNSKKPSSVMQNSPSVVGPHVRLYVRARRQHTQFHLTHRIDRSIDELLLLLVLQRREP